MNSKKSFGQCISSTQMKKTKKAMVWNIYKFEIGIFRSKLISNIQAILFEIMLDSSEL